MSKRSNGVFLLCLILLFSLTAISCKGKKESDRNETSKPAILSLEDAGFKMNLRPNKKLVKLIADGLPSSADAMGFTDWSLKIRDAIRPDCGKDFSALRLALKIGGGQKISFDGTDEHSIDPLCFAASQAMYRFGKRIIPFLIEDLRSGDDLCRFWTISALGKFGSDAAPALPLIKEALNDKNKEIVRIAKLTLPDIEVNQAKPQ